MIHPIVTVKRWWNNGGVGAPPDSPAGSIPPVGLEQVLLPIEPPWLSRLDDAGMPRTLQYPSTTLARVLDQTADRFGDSPALFYNDHRWTYRELLAQVNRTAGALASLGVRRGDRVVLALPNCPEFVTAFLAVQKLGAMVVNVGPLMGKDDLEKVFAMTTPRVAIGLDLLAPTLHGAAGGSTLEHFVWVSLQCYQPMLKWLGYQWKLWHSRDGNGVVAQDVALADLLERAPSRPPTVEPKPDAVAVLQPTGGTTGTLKLAMLTHRSLLANAMQVATWMNARLGQERTLAVLPMFHVYGLTLCLTTPIFCAGSMVLMTRFNAQDMLDLLREHKPTACPLVPAICDAISDLLEAERNDDGIEPEPIEGLRLCISGSAPLSRATSERFMRLTGAAVVEGYGLTEASPVTHSNLPNLNRSGSIGLPLPDTRVRLADLEDPKRDARPGEPGEMWISGPQLMAGYYANPEQTRQSLTTDSQGVTWLRTGDIARTDADGFFYVLDRRKDMIIRSGMKIYPGRVEQVLRRHAQVKDVAVVGRADAVYTELPVAVVAPMPPEEQRQKLADDLRALCREHLAPYEVPASVEFMDQLPRSPLGKLLKRELRNGPTPAPENGNPLAMLEQKTAAVDGANGVPKVDRAQKAEPGSSAKGKQSNGHPATDTLNVTIARTNGNGNGSGNGNGHGNGKGNGAAHARA